MRLTQLSLFNFRNYVRLALDLPTGVTVLVGDNAQGKTNLLEAVYYLATSRSPHAGSDREIVNWLVTQSEPLPYARLVGRVARSSGDLTIEITLTQQGDAEGRYRKQIRLNGVPQRAMDLLGHLNAVLFLPEDIALVSGAPGGRRHYLDATLCQIDPGYCRALSRYNQILTQRNALLRDLRERGGEESQLAFWDEQLLEHGAHLVGRRRECLDDLDGLVRQVHAELTDGAERLRLVYLPSVNLEDGETVRQAFATRLRSQRSREIAAGMTLAGPHRDDLAFTIDGMVAGVYASRGQQRTTALALKLAEVTLMSQVTGERPILLLDDVLSELDAHRRSFLLRVLDDGPQQSIITTTDLDVLPAAFVQRCHVWKVSLGRLSLLEG
jgi:DNA replication and repair protein RecF